MEGEAETNMVRKEQEVRPGEPKKEFIVTYETANLVAAVGNSEAKAITLGSMQEGVIYSRGDIHTRVMDLQAGKEGWRMGRANPLSYCQNSLAPIGLVTREAISQDLRTWGYMITPYGEEVGKALAGHLLKWSLDHPNFSLYQMLGSTASTSKPKETQEEIGEYKRRAPELRLKIFWELTKKPSDVLRQVDLVRELGEDPGFPQPHLVALQENGVIYYEARETGRPFSFYKLSDTASNRKSEPVGNRRTSTQEVYQLLQEYPTRYFSIDEMVRTLRRKYPQKYQEGKSLVNIVGDILPRLERQGLAEHRKFKHDVQSEISITDAQRETIVSLLEIIDRFQGGDQKFIYEGSALLNKILADPEKTAEVLREGKEASPMFTALSASEISSFIIPIVQGFPGVTARQVQDKLEEQYGKKLGLDSVRQLLKHLLQQGQLKSEKTKAGNVYSVPEG